MIRLHRAAPPEELDATTILEFTAEFQASKKSVWNAPFIRKRLLALSNAKCAYCETNIAEESKYMEVEHFRSKSDFPNLVVDWDNLLPACKRCNVQKGTYNVEAEGMIVNPFLDEPRDHLYFQNYRLRWRGEIGRRTIDALYLNDTDRVVGVRVKIGEAIASSLEVIRQQLEEYLTGERTTRRRNTVVRGMEALLKQAQPSSEFSATAATVLLSDPNFSWIKENLLAEGLWADIGLLEDRAASIALHP